VFFVFLIFSRITGCSFIIVIKIIIGLLLLLLLLMTPIRDDFRACRFRTVMRVRFVCETILRGDDECR